MASAGLLLQSLISRALDDDEFVLLASLDLSSGFDVVDVRLLIKRMRIMGLPDDLIILVETWLKKRFFYVEVDNVTSQLLVTWFGIIQGSILGPIFFILYSLFWGRLREQIIQLYMNISLHNRLISDMLALAYPKLYVA